MSHGDVLEMMEEMGLPFAYDHFVEGEAPEPPFAVFLYPRAVIFRRTGLRILRRMSWTLSCIRT